VTSPILAQRNLKWVSDEKFAALADLHHESVERERSRAALPLPPNGYARHDLSYINPANLPATRVSTARLCSVKSRAQIFARA
jgi:hypothetical protein